MNKSTKRDPKVPGQTVSYYDLIINLKILKFLCFSTYNSLVSIGNAVFPVQYKGLEQQKLKQYLTIFDI